MPHCLASLAANVSKMQRWELARTRHAAHSPPISPHRQGQKSKEHRIADPQGMKDFYWDRALIDRFVNYYKVPDSSSATFGGGGVKSP